jgi:hypothetical protein
MLAAMSVIAVAAVLAQADGVTIAEIQGASHVSRFKREDVTRVAGSVTAIAPGNGFYMQSSGPDANPDTSEGSYVHGRGLSPLVNTDIDSEEDREDAKKPDQDDRRGDEEIALHSLTPATFPSSRPQRSAAPGVVTLLR